MSSYTGKIKAITKNFVLIKKGPKAGTSSPVSSFEMEDGSVFEWGFGAVPAAVGDTVSFSWSTNYGKQVIDKASFTIGAGAIASAAASAGPRAAEPQKYPAKTFPLPLLHGDRVIVRQNALGHAAKLVSEGRCALIAKGSLVQDYDESTDTIIDIARKFEAYACGDLERTAADKELAK